MRRDNSLIFHRSFARRYTMGPLLKENYEIMYMAVSKEAVLASYLPTSQMPMTPTGFEPVLPP
jgi:hypothetical protein